ncbi:3-ketoacyl-CoA synthase 4 [Porphyridium purpureum]|uniref:3-ketoacyl-CoA synthase n=1 Tax=Porphyridium purpureum TaxID=35688 RepID=A0A5J4Z5T9_PORPP|nr:3-ketoacyl-CoA synthase 4 [Porphyridium purpureum]|eukprot:POR4132..scf295_1
MMESDLADYTQPPYPEAGTGSNGVSANGEGDVIGVPAAGLRRRVRRSDSSGSESTFFALAESTRTAWARVRKLYAEDDGARAADMSVVQQGYRMVNPLSSERISASLTVVLLAFLLYQLYLAREDFLNVLASLHLHSVEVIVVAVLVVVVRIAYMQNKKRPVYCMDFVTYKPPDKYTTSHKHFIELSERTGVFDEEHIAFQRKLLERSGLGDRTCFPEAMHRADDIKQAGGNGSVVLNMYNARQEAEEVMFGCLDQLFARNRIAPSEIDILIVNCSLFNPTPSLSAMIVNKYKMKSSILTYNLSGMGCSAGLISIDLAKDLLQIHTNSRAVVVSTENITQNWYLGKEKSMLITNTLFRMGGAAILMSNRGMDRHWSKYQLTTVVRTHQGSEDLAYDSIFQMEDKNGIRGVKLSKNIMDVAGTALKNNITKLAPAVFPLTEHLKFGYHLIQKKLNKTKSKKPFVPDFHKAFEHFCIHTGGRAVLEVIEKALSLTPEEMEPSRFVLERFGNVSSASVWYELEFLERAGRVRKGDRIWQIAFGSGFKCNSAVWKSLTNVHGSGTSY